MLSWLAPEMVKLKKSMCEPIQRLERVSIDRKDIFGGRKSQGLAYRRAMNKLFTVCDRNSRNGQFFGQEGLQGPHEMVICTTL